jgi:hypothetical protein
VQRQLRLHSQRLPLARRAQHAAAGWGSVHEEVEGQAHALSAPHANIERSLHLRRVDTARVVAPGQPQDVLIACFRCIVNLKGSSLWWQVGREHARKVVGAATHVGLARYGLCTEGLTQQDSHTVLLQKKRLKLCVTTVAYFSTSGGINHPFPAYYTCSPDSVLVHDLHSDATNDDRRRGRGYTLSTGLLCSVALAARRGGPAAEAHWQHAGADAPDQKNARVGG